MRRRKRILSILLAASMVCTSLVGCGQTEKNNDSEAGKKSTTVSESAETSVSEEASEESDSIRISDEVVTITVEGPSGAVAYDWTNSQQFQEYEKRLGLRFEATTYTSEQWDSRLTLMMAGDEMPDALFLSGNMKRADVDKYGSEGYLLDFSQYLDVMPNVSRLMEEYPDFKNLITSEDGSIYGFGRLNASASDVYTASQYIFLQGQWLENLGLERPKTLDDLYEVLKAFKEQDANGNGDPDDEIPLGMRNGDYYALFPIMWAYGVYDLNYYYHKMVDENGNLGIWDTTETYQEYLRFVHKLYDEGLINQDAFVLEQSELCTMVNEDKVGMHSVYYNDTTSAHEIEYYCPVGFTQEGYSTTPTYVMKSAISDMFFIVASADTEYGEELAKFVDYLYTDEGQLSARNGYDGVTFDFNEIVPGYIVADHTAKAKENGYEDTNTYRQEKALALNAIIPYVSNYGTIYNGLSELEDFYDEAIWAQLNINAHRAQVPKDNPDLKWVEVFPCLFYTEDEAAERAILYTDVENYLKTALAQFVTGEMDIDEDWDAYLNELNKMGLERLLEIDQAAYDRISK